MDVAQGVPRPKYPGMVFFTIITLISLFSTFTAPSELYPATFVAMLVLPIGRVPPVPIVFETTQEVGVVPSALVFPLLVQGTQSTQASSKPLLGSCCAAAERVTAAAAKTDVKIFFILSCLNVIFGWLYMIVDFFLTAANLRFFLYVAKFCLKNVNIPYHFANRLSVH